MKLRQEPDVIGESLSQQGYSVPASVPNAEPMMRNGPLHRLLPTNSYQGGIPLSQMLDRHLQAGLEGNPFPSISTILPMP